jgi:hypothetical protein
VNRIFAVLASASTLSVSAFAQNALPRSQLAVREAGNTRTFWRSDSAPVSWNTDPLAGAVAWRPVADGVDAAEMSIAGSGEGWRTRVILVRLQPGRLAFSLDTSWTERGSPKWNVDRAPADAVFAMNAGQFRSMLPWGRVVLDGHQYLRPERGPLAVTIGVDSAGRVHWTPDGESMPSGIAWAFQSYPVLLSNREVPAALRGTDGLLDVAHRDARLALGRFPDGSLIVALTRFDGLGGIFKSIPFGLTIPEMAAVMGALGATDAVSLDGGISAQLVAGTGPLRITMGGWRNVPLAFVARPRITRR